MHVAFHTRGQKVDHWVFEHIFPSFHLPYHLEPTLRSVSKDYLETMRFDVFFYSTYLNMHLKLG